MKDLDQILSYAKIKEKYEQEDDYYKIVVNGNKVLGADVIKGVQSNLEETDSGITMKLVIEENVKIDKSIHVCFGVLFSVAKQNINLSIVGEKNSKVRVFGHCIFPNAENVEHNMFGKINLKKGAELDYMEKHIHSEGGGVSVFPKAEVILGSNAKYKADFELIEGRVGNLEIDYSAVCSENSTVELTAKVNGSSDDKIKIRETAELNGDNSKAVIKSRIAARDSALAEVYNKIVAKGAYSFGHIDCSEIIRDAAVVKAYPDTEAMHPKARVTHEASLGGIDNKLLETLMVKGLTEKEAETVVIKGMLN